MNSKYFIALLFGMFTAFTSAHAQTITDTLFKEKYRPNYHLTSLKGALFDPTALVYVDGQYQVNRRLALSRDLVHWKHEKRYPISTDSTREMSGSVVVDSNNTSGFGINSKRPLVAIYSALRVKDGRQSQYIAYSNDDGITWLNYNKNPVIDIGSNEFRDPQVFWYAKTARWIMVVSMASEQKVRFYESQNLKEWHYLSDFGPLGAVRGVWECPDMFPLPVDDNGEKIKWVLKVDVQPVGGQYFIGNFDGKRFIGDEPFLRLLDSLKNQQSDTKGQILFDFENDLSGWHMEGDAFTASPSSGSLPQQNAVIGFRGKKLLNSFYQGDRAKGKLVSPEFSINKKFLNFLIGGGDHPGETCINLMVNNKRVRTITGVNTEVLYWKGWDVAEFQGESATLEIVDDFSGGFGHILADQFMLSDTLAKSEDEKTTWADYGPDFYASRSWVNAPDNRRIWVAWLGSWLYATSVPTSPWKGGHTFPRELKLKTFPEGIKLVQLPVVEIKKIRGDRVHLEQFTLQPGLVLKPLIAKDNSFELDLDLEIDKDGKFILNLCKGMDQKLLICYDAANAILSVDRSQSGEKSFSTSFPHTYSCPLVIRNNRVSLKILIDHSSIEIFGNGGEAVITCEIFPDPDKTGIEFLSDKREVKIKSLEFWPIGSVWNNKNN